MSDRYRGQWRRFIASAMFMVLATATAFSQWSEVATFELANNWAQYAIANGKMYMFGGLGVEDGSPSEKSFRESYVLDLSNTSAGWVKIANMPTNRFGGYAATINGKIYIMGGMTISGTSTTLSTQVLEYDPVANTYTTKRAMPTPQAQVGGAVVNNKIYIISGLNTTNTLTTTVQVYDPASDTWSTSTALPAAGVSYLATATAIGSDIYYMGGTSPQLEPLSAVYKGTVNGANITWTKIQDLPTPIARGGSGVLNGKVYITAGTGNVMTFYYDNASSSWKRTFNFPVETYNTSVMPSDGTALYFNGGYGNMNTYKFIEGPPMPIASIRKTEITLVAKKGAQSSKTLAVENNGSGPLTGSLTIPGSAGWLSAGQLNISPFTKGSISLTANAASLNAGKYTVDATLTTNDQAHSSTPIKVTLYVIESDPAVQPTRVVVEEGSGTWCGPCYNGALIAKALIDQYQEKVLFMGYHANQGGSPTNLDELHFQESSSLIQHLGLTGFPNASIHRRTFSPNTVPMMSTGEWQPGIEEVLADWPNAPIAISIDDLQYDATTGVVTGTAKFTVAEPIRLDGKTLNMSVIITQDSINLPQYSSSLGRDVTPFYHRHAVRAIMDVTGRELDISGVTLEEGSIIPPGSTFSSPFSVSITEDINSTALKVPFDAKHGAVVILAHLNQGNAPAGILQGYEQHLPASASGDAITVTNNMTEMTVSEVDSAQFIISVKNNRSEQITLQIDRTNNDLPSGWVSRICTGISTCNEPGDDNASTTIAAGGTATVRLRVRPSTSNETGFVTLRYTAGGTVVEHDYTVNSTTAGIELHPVTGNGLTLSLFPNPASNLTKFDYSIAKGGNVTVELFSTTGQKVLTMVNGRREAGAHSVNVDLSAVPNGVYKAVLSVNGQTTTQSVTIVR